MKIKDYDVLLSKQDGYEEITVEDFIKRESLSYNDEKMLLNQSFAVNIHIMVSEETVNQVYETFNDYLLKEPRLNGLNAIVLLSLKKKGRGKGFTPLSQSKFSELVNFALDNNIPIGFDSCSCHNFLKSVENHEHYERFVTLSEPCESTCFSAYINSKGEYFPCSFTEGQDNWTTGIDVTSCNDFLNDVWNSERNVEFRSSLLKNGRKCTLYEV